MSARPGHLISRSHPTSRHRRDKPDSAAPEAPPAPGPELLRRALLGLATALVVARALVPAEDPGLLDPRSNPLALAVPLAWLAGLVGWAAWRLWSGRGTLYAGAVDLALLAAVVLTF